MKVHCRLIMGYATPWQHPGEALLGVGANPEECFGRRFIPLMRYNLWWHPKEDGSRGEGVVPSPVP